MAETRAREAAADQAMDLVADAMREDGIRPAGVIVVGLGDHADGTRTAVCAATTEDPYAETSEAASGLIAEMLLNALHTLTGHTYAAIRKGQG